MGYHWTQVTANASFAPRDGAGALVFEDAMWLIGGDANQGYHQGDVWSSADGRDWHRVLEAAPWAPRVLHGAAA